MDNNNNNNNTTLLQAHCTKLQSKIYKVPYFDQYKYIKSAKSMLKKKGQYI